jgi:hypothetical protein
LALVNGRSCPFAFIIFLSLFFVCETVVPFCFPSLLFSVDEPLVHEIIRGVCDDWCLFKKINFFFIKIYEDNFLKNFNIHESKSL